MPIDAYIGSAGIPSGLPELGALLPTRIAESTGTTYYVNGDGTGSDSRTATQAQSESTPWATIQHALDTAPIGSHIMVKSGASQTVYGEQVTWTRAGTSSTVTTVEGYGSTVPRVQHQGSNGYAVGASGSGAYIRFRNFDFKGSIIDISGGPTILYWQGTTHHIELDGCEIHDAGAVTQGGAAHNRWQGTYEDSGVHHIQFWNCHFHSIDVAVAGFPQLSHNIYAPPDEFYLVSCIVELASNGYGAQFYDSGGGAISNQGAFCCTFVKNGRAGLLVEDIITGLRVINCISAGNGTLAGGDQAGFRGYSEGGTAGTDQSLDYCCAYNNPGGSVVIDAASPLVVGANFLDNVDPQFVDFTGGDYTLGPSSPCRDFGDPDYMPATDIDGNPRTQLVIGAKA